MSIAPQAPDAKRVFVLGGTGTIGRATVAALVARGHAVTCLARTVPADALPGVVWRKGDVTDPVSLSRDGFAGDRFDAVVSCLASRTGAPQDAWAIDHKAHLDALEAAASAGVTQFVLLSAICVQKPRLAFQHAKLAFEAALANSGLRYSIVRPTAYFKSLSGQVDRVKAGKAFLVFGDGQGTACKPISDRDLGHYLALCLEDPDLWNRILPIGGPGPAITPRDQGMYLFSALGQTPKFRHVSPRLLSTIAAALGLGGRILPSLAAKAELARIGHYYATESMLCLDPATGQYDAEATPEFGTDTLFSYYDSLLSGTATAERGAHAVF